MDSLIVIALVVLILILSTNTFRLANEGERLAVFSMGRFEAFKGPGLIIVAPFIQRVHRLKLGDIGVLTNPEFAKFDNVDIPVRNTDGLRQGDAVRIDGFDGFEPRLVASSIPAATMCPKCGHKF